MGSQEGGGYMDQMKKKGQRGTTWGGVQLRVGPVDWALPRLPQFVGGSPRLHIKVWFGLKSGLAIYLFIRRLYGHVIEPVWPLAN